MTTVSKSRSWSALIGFVAASFVAGAVGSWATFPSVQTWYPLLNKPAWNPPAWLFGPVWTFLYVGMGVAIWRVWRGREDQPNRRVRGLVVGYFVQLVCNALWSILFFGLKQPTWALLDIAVLWILLVNMQVRIWRLDRPAASLWLAYVLWVSFAALLNLAIVRLNPV